MTLFARGLWCGWRGAIASPAAKRSRPSSEWKARPPMPTPHCCRNQRRLASFESFIVLFFRNRFVEVEQHARHGRPDGLFLILGSGLLFPPTAEELEQQRLFLLRRQPPCAAAEREGDPRVVGGAPLGNRPSRQR